MSEHTAAVVGTGPNPGEMSRDGFAIGYRHGEAYENIANTELVCCADIVEENARAFGSRFGLGDRVFTSCAEMLTTVEPEIVSVAVPPKAHAEIVLRCVQEDSVEAIHCEKPMATRWEACQRVVAECDRRGVQLTFNHQRRFSRPFQVAKRRLDSGAIGKLVRIECSAKNIFDYGSHLVDLCGYFTGDRNAEWVIGQIDYREENKWFGAHNENQAIATWQYDNGVTGLMATGDPKGTEVVDCHHRLVGTNGEIEIGRGYPRDIDPDHHVTIVRDDVPGSKDIRTDDDGIHDSACFTRALESAVAALDSNATPLLDGRNALRATEIIFAIWESSRTHGRVDLPLTIDGNPLEAMLESGTIDPEPRE